MNHALFRYIYTVLKVDTLFLSYLGLTVTSTDVDKLKKILKYMPQDYFNYPISETKLPRVIVLASYFSGQDYSIPFLDKKYIRVIAQSTDQTGRISEQLLSRFRVLFDMETPILLETDDISYCSCLQWEKEGTDTRLHPGIYSQFNEYSISLAPKNNKKLGHLM